MKYFIDTHDKSKGSFPSSSNNSRRSRRLRRTSACSVMPLT